MPSRTIQIKGTRFQLRWDDDPQRLPFDLELWRDGQRVHNLAHKLRDVMAEFPGLPPGDATTCAVMAIDKFLQDRAGTWDRELASGGSAEWKDAVDKRWIVFAGIAMKNRLHSATYPDHVPKAPRTTPFFAAILAGCGVAPGADRVEIALRVAERAGLVTAVIDGIVRRVEDSEEDEAGARAGLEEKLLRPLPSGDARQALESAMSSIRKLFLARYSKRQQPAVLVALAVDANVLDERGGRFDRKKIGGALLDLLRDGGSLYWPEVELLLPYYLSPTDDLRPPELFANAVDQLDVTAPTADLIAYARGLAVTLAESTTFAGALDAVLRAAGDRPLPGRSLLGEEIWRRLVECDVDEPIPAPAVAQMFTYSAIVRSMPALDDFWSAAKGGRGKTAHAARGAVRGLRKAAAERLAGDLHAQGRFGAVQDYVAKHRKELVWRAPRAGNSPEGRAFILLVIDAITHGSPNTLVPIRSILGHDLWQRFSRPFRCPWLFPGSPRYLAQNLRDRWTSCHERSAVERHRKEGDQADRPAEMPKDEKHVQTVNPWPEADAKIDLARRPKKGRP